ncbi:MAG: hypothetical protein R3E88_13670 [Myxococcota bacterium]|nr:hypothetical protein [Myxococcales bacterium]
MTEREIAEIDDPEAASLSRRERLALAFAETLIALPTAMTDERFAELRREFDDGEIVEMSYFVGFYNLLHRFNAVIDLDPKAGDEIVVERLADFQLAPDDDDGAR